MTFTRGLATNNYGPAKFIVDGTTTANGTHSTIAAAIAAASSGDTIFIRPGTYTENLTLKVGVNLTAFSADDLTPNVTISGTCTLTAAGTVTISNIRLQTNGAACVDVSGAAASILILESCDIRATNSTAITYSSSSGSSRLRMVGCTGSITGAGISYWSMSASGQMLVDYCLLDNTASTTASTISAGLVQAHHSNLSFPITTSGTGGIVMHHVRHQPGVSAKALTAGGSGGHAAVFYTTSTGANTAITVTSQLSLEHAVIFSSNATAIDGAGTLEYSNVTFENFPTNNNVTTTTQVIEPIGPSVTIGTTRTGLSNVLTVQNPSNTASSVAQVLTTVGGATAGDPFHTYTVSGATSWSTGVDNSASDAYVVSASTALGTTNVMSMATGGNVSVVLGNLDTTRSASGATVTNTVSNTSNTASSHALFQATVAGNASGDALTTYTNAVGQSWSVGIDTSNSYNFVIAEGTALGTTDSMRISLENSVTFPLTPAFLAYQASTATDATGDGTVYTLGSTVDLTEVFDQGSDFNPATGIFTAEDTGRYYLAGSAQLTGGTAITAYEIQLATSNRTYSVAEAINAAAAITQFNCSITHLCDMDEGDTATCKVLSTDTGGKIDDVAGSSTAQTAFSGYLAC